eukprot:1720434-Prymnesium_polylepis.1
MSAGLLSPEIQRRVKTENQWIAQPMSTKIAPENREFDVPIRVDVGLETQRDLRRVVQGALRGAIEIEQDAQCGGIVNAPRVRYEASKLRSDV